MLQPSRFAGIGLRTQTRLFLAVLAEPCGAPLWSCCTDRTGRWIPCESHCWSRAHRQAVSGLIAPAISPQAAPSASPIESGSLNALDRLRIAGAI